MLSLKVKEPGELQEKSNLCWWEYQQLWLTTTLDAKENKKDNEVLFHYSYFGINSGSMSEKQYI